jgi:hypothetical protein
MKVCISEGERYPTLEIDDCMWRGEPMGSEPPGHYDFDQVFDIPDQLLEDLTAARRFLYRCEQAIRLEMKDSG